MSTERKRRRPPYRLRGCRCGAGRRRGQQEQRRRCSPYVRIPITGGIFLLLHRLSSMTKEKKTFTLVSASGKDLGGEYHGAPRVAAKKASKVLFGKNKVGKVRVHVRQMTHGTGHNDVHVFDVTRKQVPAPPAVLKRFNMKKGAKIGQYQLKKIKRIAAGGTGASASFASQGEVSQLLSQIGGKRRKSRSRSRSRGGSADSSSSGGSSVSSGGRRRRRSKSKSRGGSVDSSVSSGGKRRSRRSKSKSRGGSTSGGKRRSRRSKSKSRGGSTSGGKRRSRRSKSRAGSNVPALFDGGKRRRRRHSRK